MGKWGLVFLVAGDVGGVGGEWVGSLGQGLERVGWCYVCVCCESDSLC